MYCSRDHVGIGEIDLRLALVVDGDAVHADVELALAHRLDHRVPARQVPFDLGVEPLGDLVEGVVFPADAFAGLRVGEIERRVGVLGDGPDGAAAEVGQFVGGGEGRRGSEERGQRHDPKGIVIGSNSDG